MDKIDELKKLVLLKNIGAITLDEFNILKTKIISSDFNNNQHINEIGSQRTNLTPSAFEVKKSSSVPNVHQQVPIKKATNKGALSITILVLIIIFVSIISLNTNISNSGSDSKARNAVNEKPCPYCKGTGTEVCPSCNGTGVNSLGIECLCVRTAKQMIELGKSPPPYVMRWTCTHCKGTGLASNR